MARFCPKCGKEDVDFYKGFCVDCYIEMYSFVKIPKKVKIIRCKKCGAWFFRNEWIEDSFQNLEKIVSVKIKTELHKPRFEFDLEDDNAVVKITGFLDPGRRIRVGKEEKIKIEYEERNCPDCLKLSGKYFEVKIQLRFSEEKNIEKFSKVSSFIRKNTHKLVFEDLKARAFWWEEKKVGEDFFFGSKSIGRKILTQTLQKFDLSMKKSSKLRGVDKRGKKKIQFTYALRV